MSILILTFFAFLGLKLAGVVAWPWLAVFSPLMFAVLVGIAQLVVIVAIMAGVATQSPWRRK